MIYLAYYLLFGLIFGLFVERLTRTYLGDEGIGLLETIYSILLWPIGLVHVIKGFLDGYNGRNDGSR